MNQKKIRRIKREIKREITVELNALKILAPIFGGALIGVAGLWAYGVFLFGIVA